MRLGLGGEYGRYTDGLQPGSGPHSKFGYGMVKFPRQGLETRRIECDGVQLFNVARPGPLNLEISHDLCVSVDTSPFVGFRGTFKVLDVSGVSIRTVTKHTTHVKRFKPVIIENKAIPGKGHYQRQEFVLVMGPEDVEGRLGQGPTSASEFNEIGALDRCYLRGNQACDLVKLEGAVHDSSCRVDESRDWVSKYRSVLSLAVRTFTGGSVS